MAVATYTTNGTKATTAAKLDKAVFDVVPENFEILNKAYLSYLANGRVNLAKTKTRGDVSGGGKKPWRQKGTGRARFGSSRVPIWRGGGITFGPTGNESYGIKLSLQTKRLAIRQALSLSAKENQLIVIEDFKVKGAKTAELVKLLAKIGAMKRTLLVVDHKTPEMERAVANIPQTRLVTAKYLNAYEVVNADAIVISAAALTIIHEWLGA